MVYLMRGLPACGKSFTARRLAGEAGVICETDEYFYSQVGDDPTRYEYRAELLPAARQWNLQRFQQAVAAGQSPIVVDRGNGLNVESQEYAVFALQHRYKVELKEPESAWWQEIRVLLQQRPASNAALRQWAERLAEMSRTTHRVSAATIRDWMDHWRTDLTLDHIVRGARPGMQDFGNLLLLRDESGATS